MKNRKKKMNEMEERIIPELHIYVKYKTVQFLKLAKKDEFNGRTN